MSISMKATLQVAPTILDEKRAKEIILNMPQKSYDWVDFYDEEDSLEDILKAWRYEINRDKSGSIIVSGHKGKKVGEDDKLWWNLKSVVSDMELSIEREDGFTHIISVKNHVYSEKTR